MALLEPYRVLDCTGELGWLTGRFLSDMGCDVVKIEPPGADLSAPAWRGSNAGKRLATLDLTTQAGRDAFLKMAAKADFLIETAEPGSDLAKLFLNLVLTAQLNSNGIFAELPVAPVAETVRTFFLACSSVLIGLVCQVTQTACNLPSEPSQFSLNTSNLAPRLPISGSSVIVL
jgi:hypothetical protein